MKAWQKEMVACQEVMEVESVAVHEGVPEEEAQ
jgi:hypothetical protein